MYRYIKNFIKDYVYVDKSTTKQDYNNKYNSHHNNYEVTSKNNNDSVNINIINDINNANFTVYNDQATLKDKIKDELKDELKNELKNELKDEILNELKDDNNKSGSTGLSGSGSVLSKHNSENSDLQTDKGSKNNDDDNNKSGGTGLGGSGSISGGNSDNDSNSAGPSNFRSFFDQTVIILITITTSILDAINEIFILM